MKFNLLLLAAAITLILIVKPVLAQSAEIIDTSLSTTNLYFTGTSTDPKTWYQDVMGNNLDAGIKLCDAGQKYVGAVYASNVGGSWKYVLVSYRSSSNALAFTDQSAGGTCYYTTHGYLTFSPSHLLTPDPDVYYAAFPGRLWVVYDTNSNPGTFSNFVLTSQRLLGDYSFSRTYSQSTNQITVNTPTISFQTSSGIISKDAHDSTFGVSSERRMVVGICSDSYGQNCYSGAIVPVEDDFPLQMDSGASPVDDQHTYQRYVVMNSIGKPICIGANLKVTINSVTPDPVYYSQNLTISFTMQNKRDTPTEEKGGNVQVTTNFYVHVKIYRTDNTSYVVFDKSYPITQDFDPDDTLSMNIIWPAYAKSGDYRVEVTVDSNDAIAECVESDNTDTDTFTLKPIILPEIWINGNQTTTFPFAGAPFNLTMHIKNSDGVNVSNATVQLIEENGISEFAPTQLWDGYVNQNSTQKLGTKIINTVEFPTDYYGNVMLTLIPTGNPLYAPEYNYVNMEDTVGIYSLKMEGTTFEGEPFVFVVNGNVTYSYPLQVNNYYRYENTTTSSSLPNLDSFVTLAMNTVYTIFTKFWNAVAG